AISEFFTGQESHQAGRVVVRTDPAQRDGLYFILELSRPNAIGSVRLEWIPTDQKEARTQVFTLPAGASAREVLLGLTGEQAPASGIRPLAWRIEVLGVDGSLIDSHESFLWRM
ncbi:hypothetical protein RZS08_42835, partial [Arthrospira platensis SPKY1]|nr:hypothetical protein [Arthrospira platensis SPKY1]